MSITYKTDDSFFTTVLPPFAYYGGSVKSWLQQNSAAKFRYIRDTEVEQEFWKAQQVIDVYIEIKMISIVINPWARMRYAYTQLCKMKKDKSNPYQKSINLLNLYSFEDFIINLQDNTIAIPMCKWFDHEVNGEQKTVDYILKDYSLEDDFKVIQEYFCSDTPLVLPKKLPSYKRYYNTETKEIVAKLFKEDIERFNYKF